MENCGCEGGNLSTTFLGGCNCGSLQESMARYIGQTVTIFTSSGGASGCGFTGVLMYVNCNSVGLINRIGEAPACPLGGYGSCCGDIFNSGCNSGCGCRSKCGNSGWGNNGGYGNGYYGNPLGSVTEIPICNIASFTHNAL